MSLRRLIRTWDELGRRDPLWAVLSHPDMRGGGWNLDRFLETGRTEIDVALGHARTHRPDLPTRRALDFGCGVGRLTQALGEHFDEVDGVDLSPSMIEKANELNRLADRCRYHLNQVRDLNLFQDGRFDFVYSVITLQHMPPDLAAGYIAEFCRVLAPGGLAMFQMPVERRDGRLERTFGPLGRAARSIMIGGHVFWHRTVRRGPVMDMFTLSETRVRAAVSGAEVLCAAPDDSAGPDWLSYRYCIARYSGES